MSNGNEAFCCGFYRWRQIHAKSALCLHTSYCMMSFSNSTKETNFVLFPMYSKAQLYIFDLMKMYCVQEIFSGVWPANNYERKVQPYPICLRDDDSYIYDEKTLYPKYWNIDSDHAMLFLQSQFLMLKQDFKTKDFPLVLSFLKGIEILNKSVHGWVIHA